MPTNGARSSTETVAPFIISRHFKALRAQVWRAFTEAEHLKHWWGPKGVRCSVATMDLKPGGMFHYCLTLPDGKEMWGRWVLREIAAPERLVYVNSFSDANRGLTRHPMAPDWPAEMLTTITFTEEAGATTVTVRWDPIIPSAREREVFDAGRDSMRGGWGGSFDVLEAYLATK